MLMADNSQSAVRASSSGVRVPGISLAVHFFCLRFLVVLVPLSLPVLREISDLHFLLPLATCVPAPGGAPWGSGNVDV